MANTTQLLSTSSIYSNTRNPYCSYIKGRNLSKFQATFFLSRAIARNRFMPKHAGLGSCKKCLSTITILYYPAVLSPSFGKLLIQQNVKHTKK